MIFNVSNIFLSQLHAHYDVAAFHGGGMMDHADDCAANAEEQLPAESSTDKVSKFTTTSDRNESLLTRIPGVPAITKHPTGPISALWDQSEDDSEEIRRLLEATHGSFSPKRSLDLNFGRTVSLSDNPRLGDNVISTTTPSVECHASAAYGGSKKHPNDEQFESPSKPTCEKRLDSLGLEAAANLAKVYRVQQSNYPKPQTRLSKRVQQSNIPRGTILRGRKSSSCSMRQNIVLQFTFGKLPLAGRKPFHIQWPTTAA